MPLVFSLILTVASRLLHPYHSNDNTSRLMEKKFSTVRDPQRGSQSYMEKRRGRREIEMTRRRRGGIKKERAVYPVINSLCALHSLEHPERFTELHREEKRKEIVVTRRRGGIKRRETDLVSNQFPKCSPQPGIPKEIHRVELR